MIRRIARRLKNAVKDIKSEANHPGQSPPHRVDREDRFQDDKKPEAAKDEADRGEEKPWYLDGEDAYGWENTNADGDE